MAEPSDLALYDKSKAEVNKNYDKPSAYRSMAYARTYLKNYREKYGDDKKAYKGKNPESLKTWRKDKWVDVKSFVKDPKNPTACGNAPIKKGEYPLCMPIAKAQSYNKSELNLLIARKNQIGKRRLVKDAFLRDVLEPEKITPIREYKDKYVKEPKNKLPKPLPKAQAEKILKEKPIKAEKPIKEPTPVLIIKDLKEPKPPKELTAEEIEQKRKDKNARQQAAYKPRPPRAKKVQVPKAVKSAEDKVPVKKGPGMFSDPEAKPKFDIKYGPVTLDFNS
jgi:hypothetical protein